MLRFVHAAFLSALLGTSVGPCVAQERPRRLEIWDLALGAAVAQLPDEFVDYACGTNGGPPSRALEGWRDFRLCRPETSGLREVYFRYDDELEYWARANNLLPQMEQYSGTRAYGFPVIASVLISDDGTVDGIRMVSDPREDRDEAYLLRNFLTARLGREGWDCEELPPAQGESAVAGIFVNQRCRKRIDAQTMAFLSTRHLRKAGQSGLDRVSGKETRGQFESVVRFELIRGAS
jgi:hypothetical protein